ncbi:MAG: glycosyltransferase [Acidobacteria bacterium]|nr:MAG: glycosyltransferase [Acidobacteriota bacterium]
MKILVVHPNLQLLGGGATVAAWLLEALRGRHELTLLTWQPPPLAQVNAICGTSLEPGDFRLILMPRALRRALRLLPLRAALLRWSLLARRAQLVLRREPYDLAISTENEMDFARRGIQYVHFPRGSLPRPRCDLRWYHRLLPFSVGIYHLVCERLARSDGERLRHNLTLVNSHWTGAHFRALYGVEPRLLYPPVPGEFPRRSWAERRDGFVAAGRMAPEKRYEMLIGIVETLRRRGHRVDLHLVTGPGGGHGAYGRRILAMAERRRRWVTIHRNLPRAALIELMARHRYGIHGMAEEHFGIAVAELQRAGAIVFVPAGGGQVEIVGGDERLIYGDAGDAVAKIERVLSDPALQRAVRRDAARRRDRFSSERFVAEVRQIVATFDARAMR